MKIKALLFLVFFVNIIWEGVIPVEADGMVFAHYMLSGEDSRHAEVDYVVGSPHRAFLELGEHYIRWYKSGSEPAITEDSLYMFYYTHPTKMASDGRTVNSSKVLSDKLYVTAMLTGPATLELNSGGVSQLFEVTEAGISTREMDFKQGQQSAVLKRGGLVISTLNGTKPTTSSGVSNFNVYSTCTKCN